MSEAIGELVFHDPLRRSAAPTSSLLFARVFSFMHSVRYEGSEVCTLIALSSDLSGSVCHATVLLFGGAPDDSLTAGDIPAVVSRARCTYLVSVDCVGDASRVELFDILLLVGLTKRLCGSIEVKCSCVCFIDK